MRRALAAVALTACGYHPVHGGAPVPASERCDVVLARSDVPDAVVADEVLAGAREELARAGALGGPARCRVEVLRIDEASEGVAAVRGPSENGEEGRLLPTSRATRVGVVARADWAKTADPDAPGERDTADVRVFETVSVAPDARNATFRHTDALRAAARRLGRRLGTRLLGRPAPSDE